MTNRILGSAAIATLGMLLGATAHAAEGDPRKLGTQWEGRDGNTHFTQLGLRVREGEALDPALYRESAFDWRRSELQAGWYPKTAFAEGVGGTVELEIDVDATGTPRDCRVVASSGHRDLDSHACPHVREHVRFVPALSSEGMPLAGPLRAALDYEVCPAMLVTAAEGSPAPEPPQVQPLQPIDAATAGIAGTVAPADVRGVGGSLLVARDGVPSACRLRETTGDDAVDRRICDSLLARARFPARDADDARLHTFWLPWPADGKTR